MAALITNLSAAAVLAVGVMTGAAEEPKGVPGGPILLPLNPPYLEAPLQNEPTPQAVQPAGQQTAEDEQTDRQQPADVAERAATEQAETEQAETEQPAPEPKPELTAAQAALRDRLRRTIATHQGQPLSTDANSATEIMYSCLAFGCDTQVSRSRSTGGKVNGITCLCWNYPCAGHELLTLCEDHIAPRIGYGLQDHPSQLLAVLALARVKPDYPLRVGEDVRSVADLVEHEKLNCRSGADLSLTLIALAHYLDDEPTWTNRLGQQWSIERIVREELAQPILTAPCGGTYRLMGLSSALARREKDGQPIDGQYARARQFLEQYHDYALKVQNSDGSWGPQFLAARGTSRDQATQLRSTGMVLQWLAMSLPEDRLDEPAVVRAVQYVDSLLSGQRYRRGVTSLSTQEIGAVMHALHALAVYDQRFLAPRVPEASEG